MEKLGAYTTDEAAKALKVTRRTLYNYIRGGQIRAARVGRKYWIQEEELRDFVKRGTDEQYLTRFQRSRRPQEPK